MQVGSLQSQCDQSAQKCEASEDRVKDMGRAMRSAQFDLNAAKREVTLLTKKLFQVWR